MRLLKLKRTKAFTLVEAVITMCLFGITACVVLSGIAFAMKQQQHIRDTKAATQILVDKTEVIRLCTLEQVRNPFFMPRTFVDGKFNGTVVVDKVPFVNKYSQDMSRVTFTVSWETCGAPRTKSWVTYVARDGLVNYVAR